MSGMISCLTEMEGVELSGCQFVETPSLDFNTVDETDVNHANKCMLDQELGCVLMWVYFVGINIGFLSFCCRREVNLQFVNKYSGRVTLEGTK